MRHSLIKALTSPNPVTVKELRSRMRGARAFIFVTFFLAVMGCLVSLIYGLISQAMQVSGGGGPQVHEVGKIIFGTVVIVELFAVSLLAPAFSAGAIAGERQRQTFDLLRTTLLPARSVVIGKLLSSLTFLLLLVLTGLPLVSLAFLLGGVTLLEVGIATALLVVTALSFSAIGLLFSSLLKTSLAATVISYVMAVLSMVGLPVLMFIGISFAGPFMYVSMGPVPGSHPNWTLLAVLFYVLGFFAATNPLLSAILTEALLLEGNTALVFSFNLGTGFNLWIVSPWVVFVVFHVFATGLLILASVRFVRRKR
jgi:ABC-2 type transport system permease protein